MLKILAGIVVLSVLIVGAFDYYVRTYTTKNSTNKEFVIGGEESPSGRDSLFDVGEKLEQENIIDTRYFFYYYAWRNQLRGKILAGRYDISSRSTFAEVTRLFTKGEIIEEKPQEISVTFREGKTLTQYAQELEQKSLPHEEFLKIANNPPQEMYDQYSFLKQGESLEGFLFPETHFFLPQATATDIIKKYLDEFDKQVSQSMRENIEGQGKSLFEVITLASIVEGEVTQGIDRGIVAGIFQNRLDIDMPLQTDASIVYITGDPQIKHTLEDLEVDSPYNTYIYPGLPPGPINSPSLESIIAAMNPSETEYFFFLNSNTEENRGETIFAETFEQHIINKNNNGL